MAIVKNTLRLPHLTGSVANRTITVSLVSGSTGGFIGSTVEVLSKSYTQTDSTGLWSIDLTPNVQITSPTGTYYTVTQFGEALSFVVPNTAGGPFNLLDILVQSPSSPAGLVVGALASRQIIAGTGLTGGGDLTADRTLAVGDLSATYALVPGPAVNALTGMYHADGYSGIDKTGAADSTTGINALHAAVPAGSTIFYPAGTYKITAALTAPANDVVVQGVGKSSIWSFQPAAGATMMTLTSASRIKFIGMQFTLPGTTAGAGSRLFKLSNTFRCSWMRCVFQGQHTAAADAYGVTTGHVGVVLAGNSGDNLFIDTDFLNLGVGIMVDSIQNAVIGGKFGTCYVGIWGTSNIDGDGQPNAGMALSGYIDFVSSGTAGLVTRNILIDTAAGQWWISDCWFEGADTAVQVGDVTNGGPKQFNFINSKVSALTKCVDMRVARQPFLAGLTFDPPGSGTPTSLTIDATNCPEGVATSLISTITGDPSISGNDFASTVFPLNWTYLGRATTKVPSRMSGATQWTSTADGSPALELIARSGQTSNVFEAYDTAGVKRVSIDKNGSLGVGIGSASGGFQANGQINTTPGGASGVTPNPAGTIDAACVVVPRTAGSRGLTVHQFLNTQTQDLVAFRSTSAAKADTGDMSVVNAGGVFVSDSESGGIVLKDSAGTPHYWRLTVSTAGVLTTTDLGTTRPTN
jgi:hypothetical protein